MCLCVGFIFYYILNDDDSRASRRRATRLRHRPRAGQSPGVGSPVTAATTTLATRAFRDRPFAAPLANLIAHRVFPPPRRSSFLCDFISSFLLNARLRFLV